MSRPQGKGSKPAPISSRGEDTGESPIAISAIHASGSGSTSNGRKRRRAGRATAQLPLESPSRHSSQAQSQTQPQSHKDAAASQLLWSPSTSGKPRAESASSANALQPQKYGVMEVGSSSPESAPTEHRSKRRKRSGKKQKNAQAVEGTSLAPIEIPDGESMLVGSSAERYETASEMDPSTHVSDLSTHSTTTGRPRLNKGKSKASSPEDPAILLAAAQAQAGSSTSHRAETTAMQALKTQDGAEQQEMEKLKAQLESYKQVIQAQNDTLQAINGECICHVCTESVWRPFVLVPCGHMFCLACLVAWFQRLGEGEIPLPPAFNDRSREWNQHEAMRRTLMRNKVCPECRTTLTEPPVELWSVKMVIDKMHEGAKQLATLTQREGLQDIKAIMPADIGLYPPEETLVQRDARLGLSDRLVRAQEVVLGKQTGVWRDIFAKRKARGSYPRWDGDDAVWRCPECACEIEDTNCESCGYEAVDLDDWTDREEFEQRRLELAEANLTWSDMEAIEGAMAFDFSEDDYSDADSEGNLAGFIDDMPTQNTNAARREAARASRLRARRLAESDEEEEAGESSVRLAAPQVAGAPQAGSAPAQAIHVDDDNVYDVDDSGVDDSDVDDDDDEDEDDFIDGPRRPHGVYSEAQLAGEEPYTDSDWTPNIDGMSDEENDPWSYLNP